MNYSSYYRLLLEALECFPVVAGLYLFFRWKTFVLHHLDVALMCSATTCTTNHKRSSPKDEMVLELVLDGRNTFQWSLEMLNQNNRTTEEVKLVNYSPLNAMNAKALVEVFEAVATLPRLQKVSIDFRSPLPLPALTGLLKGLQASKPWWKRRWHDRPNFHSLHISVRELAGSKQDLEEMSAQLVQYKALQNLSLRYIPNFTEKKDIKNLMERDLLCILQVLQHHPSLQELTLLVPMSAPKQEATPILDAMISLVQTNRHLTHLTLNSWSNKPWYIKRLAQALSLPNPASNLRSLDFEFPTLQKDDPTLVQGMMALEEMLQHNCNLTDVSAGTDNNNLLYERNWGTAAQEVPNQSWFYTHLNRLGRKRLLCGAKDEDWMEAIIRDRNNVEVTFYWLSHNPNILPAR